MFTAVLISIGPQTNLRTCESLGFDRTWNTLKDNKEEADKAKSCTTEDDALDEQELPPLNRYAEIEYPDRDL